jgi:surfeit locus 1 family protein
MWTAGHRFSPAWWAVLLTMIFVAVFVGLGLWQLDRAAQKRELAGSFERGTLRTVPLTAGNVSTLPRYQQVELRGRYDAERQILLDNMASSGRQTGRPGYHVWTLLRLERGGVVLVNRGWVPLTESRDRLPDIPVDDGPRVLVGRIDELPQPGVRLAPTVPKGRWPEVLYYPTAEELSKLYEQVVPARVVLLDARAADGYERTWRTHPEGFGAEQHIGYAAQWFAFAVGTLIVFLVVNLKKRPST